MRIRELYLDDGHINIPGTLLTTVRSYVFHYTANSSPTATAEANRDYFNRPYEFGKYKSSAGFINTGWIEYGSAGDDGIGIKFAYGSSQVIVDENEVVLPIRLTNKAYGCGDDSTPLALSLFNGNQNSMTINVEICNNGDWDKACDNAIEFVAHDIVDRNKGFNFNDEHAFLRHYDVSGKICPEPFVDLTRVEVDDDWVAFKNKLLAKINQLLQPDIQSGSKYFIDVPVGHWAVPMIDKAREYGLISGIGPNILGFSEDFARVIALQMNVVSLVEGKFGSLKP